MIWLLLVGFFFLGEREWLYAQELPQFQVQAQSYIFDREKNVFVYKNAKIEWNDLVLEGKEVHYDPEKRSIVAFEYVRFFDPPLIFVVDRLEYNLQTKKRVMKNAVIFNQETKTYLTAKEIFQEGDEKIIAKECTVTTCDPQNPAWRITSREVVYEYDHFSTAKGATLQIKGAPVFYTPYFFWPTVDRRKSGFLPPALEYYDTPLTKYNLGYRLGIPYFWAIDEDHDLTITGGLIQHRGMEVKLDYQYAYEKNLRGEIMGRYIWDQYPHDILTESGSKNGSIGSIDRTPPRFTIQSNHNQQLGDRTRLIISSTFYSDSQYVPEFERIESDPIISQQIQATLSHQLSQGDVSLRINQIETYEEIALFNRDLDRTQLQLLPEISYSLTTNLIENLSFSVEGTITRFFREQGFRGTRSLMSPTLFYHLEVGKWNTISQVGKRLSNYWIHHSDSVDSQQNLSYDVNTMKVEVNTAFSRIWNVQEGRYSRLRHLMTPRILFEGIEDKHQGVMQENEPFDGKDAIAAKQLLTFRVDHVFSVKKRRYVQSVRLTAVGIKNLQDKGVTPSVIQKLKTIVDQEFSSQDLFLKEVSTLLEGSMPKTLPQQLLFHAEKGMLRLAQGSIAEREEEESSVLAELNIIQRYNVLRQFDTELQGPTIKDQETTSGQPWLPLLFEFSLQPGVARMNFFARYNHYRSQFVEFNASFDASLSDRNKIAIGYRNNNRTYRTPDDIENVKKSSLEFENTIEMNDQLTIGFTGVLDLQAPAASGLQRRLIEDSAFVRYRSECYLVDIQLREKMINTSTATDANQYVVDRSLILNISLGNAQIPTQHLVFSRG